MIDKVIGIVGKDRFAIILIIAIFLAGILIKEGFVYFVHAITTDIGAQMGEFYGVEHRIPEEKTGNALLP